MALQAEAEVDVATDVPTTFAVLSDPGRFHEWQDGMEAGHTAGPVGVGSRFRSHRSVAGMRMPFTTEIVTWDPPHRMVFRSVRTPLRVRGTYTVAPLEAAGSNRARVRVSMSVEVPTFGPFRLGDRAEPYIRAELESDLSRLRTLLSRPEEQAGYASDGADER
jgi:uncharacterized protein YndB with AHSA1/START domain